jgi:dUTP pyrophosphatase
MAKAPAKPITVNIVVLPHARDLPRPAYQTSGSVGQDLVAALPAGKPLKLKRGARALIPTGLVFELPAGYEAQVRPRSGLAVKHGLTVLNSPGTIDSDYRGEVQVILINLGEKTVTLKRGERIAQVVFAPVTRVALQDVKVIKLTQRGAGGFGSTGVAATKASAKKVAAKVVPKAKPKASLTKARQISFPRRPMLSRSQRRS